MEPKCDILVRYMGLISRKNKPLGERFFVWPEPPLDPGPGGCNFPSGLRDNGRGRFP